MTAQRLLSDLNLYEFTESLIPDFVLGFAFFTSIAYAVLGRKFERQRPAIAASVSIGFALSTGLVWWERANGLSIKNLGPIAVGFIMLFLGFVMYQSIKQVGGTWAGAGLALGISILVARILKLDLFIDPDVIQTLTLAALFTGIIAFILHSHKTSFYMPYSAKDSANTKLDMSELFRNRHISDRLSGNMRKLRRQANNLYQRPEEAANVAVQLKRMLPAQGYLTQTMAQLRTKAHRIRNGHIARLQETKKIYSKLPASEKKKAAAKMAAAYNQMIGIDTKLERLDKAVSVNERKIKQLTDNAEKCIAGYDYKKLTEILKQAEKLQKHNSKLFKIIHRTEEKLTAIAEKIAKEAKRQK